MSVQMKFTRTPKFDDEGRCLKCGELGELIPALGYHCEVCPPKSTRELMLEYIDQDATKLSNSWDKYSALVHDKLMENATSGKRSGWDDPEWTADDVKTAMLKHIEKGDPIDIAAFAMFWWYKKGAGND